MDPDRILAAVQELTAARLKGPDGKSTPVLVNDGSLGIALPVAFWRLKSGRTGSAFKLDSAYTRAALWNSACAESGNPGFSCVCALAEASPYKPCLNRSDDAVPCVCHAVLRILDAGDWLPAIRLMLLGIVSFPLLSIWAGIVEVRRTLLVQD